jgi:MarR family transcriptional regulator, transcriptional regulator for hemolysin
LTIQQFFNEYRLIYRPFTNQINMHLEKHGLFSSQWGLLRMLEDKGPQTFVDIANLLYIEKPSVTKLVQKLNDLELVEIKPGKDKREKMVHLTAHGKEVIAQIHQELQPILEGVLAGVSMGDIEIAKRVLAKIRVNLING